MWRSAFCALTKRLLCIVWPASFVLKVAFRCERAAVRLSFACKLVVGLLASQHFNLTFFGLGLARGKYLTSQLLLPRASLATSTDCIQLALHCILHPAVLFSMRQLCLHSDPNQLIHVSYGALLSYVQRVTMIIQFFPSPQDC